MTIFFSQLMFEILQVLSEVLEINKQEDSFKEAGNQEKEVGFNWDMCNCVRSNFGLHLHTSLQTFPCDVLKGFAV